MKQSSLIQMIVAGLTGMLMCSPIFASQLAQAQSGTPTPTANATSATTVSPIRTPTARTATAIPTVAPAATRELAATEPVTPGELLRGGTITVDGIGQVSAVPDAAVIELGVQNRAVTASVALSATATQIDALLDVLSGAGVASVDIQTQNVSLFPVYDQPQTSTGEPVLTGFSATNIVRVRVRNLSNLGPLLDAAIEAGANTIQGVQFELSDPASQMAQARAAAVADARRKAEQLADLAGTELGSIRAIIESSSPVQILPSEAMAGGRSVPIAPGAQTVQVVVQITWQVN